MTNKNKPNVSIVTGIEIICNIGLINIFSNVSTMTTIIEDPQPSTLTPGKKLANKKTNRAVINKFTNFSKNKSKGQREHFARVYKVFTFQCLKQAFA